MIVMNVVVIVVVVVVAVIISLLFSRHVSQPRHSPMHEGGLSTLKAAEDAESDLGDGPGNGPLLRIDEGILDADHVRSNLLLD